MTRAAAACWLAAGITYLGMEMLAASAFPGYSYTRDVISTLGAPNSPLRWAMNAAFVVQGTLFCAGTVLCSLATEWRKPFLLFASANAVGNVLVAVIPAGGGWLHVAGAGLAIVGGNAAILAGARRISAARSYLVVSAVLGGAGLVGLMLFVTTGSAVAERLSVYTIIVWQMLSALVMLSAAERPTSCRRGLRRRRNDPTGNPGPG